MVEELIQNLMEAYKADLEDYSRLGEKMRNFQRFLEEKDEQLNDEKLKAQNLEKELEGFWEFHKECFEVLQQRSGQSIELQTAVCSEIGDSAFKVSRLKQYLPEKTFNEFSRLTIALQNQMQEILGLDEMIIPKLNLELNAIKLELNRLQNARIIKNTYDHRDRREARFIDKKK